MKEVIGSPRTKSGLILRLGQCLFAAVSLGVMVVPSGFASYTTFCMSSTIVQLRHSRSMGLYEPPQQFIMWKDVYKGNDVSSMVAGADAGTPSIMKMDNFSLHRENEYAFEQPARHSDYNDEISRLAEKIKRRLAQNREAVRKSRLRKKAYVKQLESSWLKLAQVEQELERAKHQPCSGRHNDMYVGNSC